MKITQEYEIKIRLKYDAKVKKKVKWDYITRNGRLIASYKYNPQKHQRMTQLLRTNPPQEKITNALKPQPKYIHKAGEYAIYRQKRNGQRVTLLKKNGSTIWEEPHWGKKAYDHAINEIKQDRYQGFKAEGIYNITTPEQIDTGWYRSSAVYSYNSKSSDQIDIRAWVHTNIPTNEQQTLEQIASDILHDNGNLIKIEGLLERVFEERAEPIHESEIDPPRAPPNEYQGWLHITQKNNGREFHYTYRGTGPGRMNKR